MVQMLRPWKTVLHIDFNNSIAVYRQIANGIINEIRKGRLKPGAALPGSRVIAADIGVNRKTVVLAYEELIAEGWLEAADKKGTFVAARLPDDGVRKEPRSRNFAFYTHPELIDTRQGPDRPLISFNDGLPDVRLAPMDELAKAYKRIFQQKTRWRMLGYGHVQGEERLRHAIAYMLSHKRGINVDERQLCITRGSQMALFLTVHTLIRPGDTVVMETPGYLPAWETFRHAGARMLPVAVDEKGLVTESLEVICKAGPVKAIYVTPHHQFPTTVSMKMERRLELIALSNRYGFAIIEDDYDHEFHFETRSLFPLASHEHAANVIYISSLSKLVAPAVRIGYVAGPVAFIESLAQLRSIVDRQGDTIMEQAVAELLEAGTIARHARRAAAIYKTRCASMDHALKTYLGDKVLYQKPEGGLAFWVKFTGNMDTEKLANRLLKKGVAIIPTERFSFDGKRLDALRLGFASLNEQELDDGIRLIAAAAGK